MSARDDLMVELTMERCNDDQASSLIDAFRLEVQRELILKMRRQLAASLALPHMATVIVAGGRAEPLSTTHLLDAWDPDRDGTMRPAREALAELREWAF